jgi:hypothetical protein
MRHVRYIEELVGMLRDKGALLENSLYSSKEAAKKSTRGMNYSKTFEVEYAPTLMVRHMRPIFRP